MFNIMVLLIKSMVVVYFVS